MNEKVVMIYLRKVLKLKLIKLINVGKFLFVFEDVDRGFPTCATN
jgi:hypothetical protein